MPSSTDKQYDLHCLRALRIMLVSYMNFLYYHHSLLRAMLSSHYLPSIEGPTVCSRSLFKVMSSLVGMRINDPSRPSLPDTLMSAFKISSRVPFPLLV
ncbi:unnamed protein product [Somion occarium]|uniref:Maturase K n=1 Tax=Somion occarium TaxID=3059160 RepID=A0ABP1DUS5_9APHY